MMGNRTNIDAAVDALADSVPSGHLLAATAGGADLLTEAARLLDERLRERDEAVALLERLTPGGSEFANDPERCAEHVRTRLSSVVRLKADRDAARAEVQTLREALGRIIAEETWLYDDPGSANPPVRLGGKTMRARIRNIAADVLCPEEAEL